MLRRSILWDKATSTHQGVLPSQAQKQLSLQLAVHGGWDGLVVCLADIFPFISSHVLLLWPVGRTRLGHRQHGQGRSRASVSLNGDGPIMAAKSYVDNELHVPHISLFCG